MAAIGRVFRVVAYICTVLIMVEILALVFAIILCGKYPQGSRGWQVAHGEGIAGRAVGAVRYGRCSVYDRAGNVKSHQDCETWRAAYLMRQWRTTNCK
jgi:hypothetical protein